MFAPTPTPVSLGKAGSTFGELISGEVEVEVEEEVAFRTKIRFLSSVFSTLWASNRCPGMDSGSSFVLGPVLEPEPAAVSP